MNSRRTGIAVAIAVAFVGGTTMAQGIQEVKIIATRNITTKLVGHTSSGIPIRDLSVTYGVSLEDLDLSTASGAADAEKRVNDAALAACQQIGHQYPDATPSEDVCARTAAKNAMGKVHKLVAAAEAARK